MHTFTVQSCDRNGRGYAVVERDNGETFGLNFVGMPVHDPKAFRLSLLALIDEQVQRVQAEATAAQIHPDVAALIGQPEPA